MLSLSLRIARKEVGNLIEKGLFSTIDSAGKISRARVFIKSSFRTVPSHGINAIGHTPPSLSGFFEESKQGKAGFELFSSN